MSISKPISHWYMDSSTAEWRAEMRKIESEHVLDLQLERLEKLAEMRATRDHLRNAVLKSQAETQRLVRLLAETETELSLLAAEAHVYGGVK